MKKVLFFPALGLLILANVLVYSCRKDNAVSGVPATNAVTEDASAKDRNAGVCPVLNIRSDGALMVCGVDNGPATCAAPCVIGTNFADNVPVGLTAYAFSGSTFSLSNPNNVAVTVQIFFNCGPGSQQTFVIPAMSSLTFRVAPNGLGCCQAVTPC